MEHEQLVLLIKKLLPYCEINVKEAIREVLLATARERTNDQVDDEEADLSFSSRYSRFLRSKPTIPPLPVTSSPNTQTPKETHIQR